MKRCNEQRICEMCGIEYTAKVVTARFCSRKCMYEWRKSCNWEGVKCVGCGKEFRRRKNEKHYRTGLPRQYCSNDCSLRSPQKRDKLRRWGLSKKNHWNKQEVQDKVKKTKKVRYGDENYNNMEKNVATCMERYDRPYTILLKKAQSNGKRVSKVHRLVYEQIEKQHSDAMIEHWLGDAQKSVDIFIPSQKKVIEVYGTYWHCDPRKYSKDYFNKSVKMTAEEMWKRDEVRVKFLEALGYTVEVVWESDINGV